MAEEIKKEEPMDAACENQEAAQTDNLATESADSATTDADAAENAEDIASKDARKEGRKSFLGKRNKKEEQLKKQLEELEQQKGELSHKFLMLYSEFDNYKKRTNKEKLDLMATASEKVIVNLLPVLDDFERAIKANESLDDVQVMKDGFVLIYNKLQKLLADFDVEEIVAKGEDFNTDFHEAITHFPAPTEDQKGKVMDVTQKGYKIKDKVIRYAKVVVAQ